jgi:hypothetical protein
MIFLSYLESNTLNVCRSEECFELLLQRKLEQIFMSGTVLSQVSLDACY